MVLRGSYPAHGAGGSAIVPITPTPLTGHTQGPAWPRISEVQAEREPGLDPWVGAVFGTWDQAFWAEARPLTSEKLEEEGGKAHAVVVSVRSMNRVP